MFKIKEERNWTLAEQMDNLERIFDATTELLGNVELVILEKLAENRNIVGAV